MSEKFEEMDLEQLMAQRSETVAEILNNSATEGAVSETVNKQQLEQAEISYIQDYYSEHSGGNLYDDMKRLDELKKSRTFVSDQAKKTLSDDERELIERYKRNKKYVESENVAKFSGKIFLYVVGGLIFVILGLYLFFLAGHKVWGVIAALAGLGMWGTINEVKEEKQGFIETRELIKTIESKVKITDNSITF